MLHRRAIKFKLTTRYRRRYSLALLTITCFFCTSLIMLKLRPVHATMRATCSSNNLDPVVHDSSLSGSQFAPFQNSVLLGLPFSASPIRPVFNPIAGYPKYLCLFSSVQLDPQYSHVPSRSWPIDLPGLPLLDLLYTPTQPFYRS
jgi:hypothetical protein